MNGTMGQTTVTLEDLIKLEKPRKFLNDKIEYLMKTYPDKYVAIEEDRVLLAEDDLNELLAEIRAQRGSTRGVLIDYISPKQGRTFF